MSFFCQNLHKYSRAASLFALTLWGFSCGAAPESQDVHLGDSGFADGSPQATIRTTMVTVRDTANPAAQRTYMMDTVTWRFFSPEEQALLKAQREWEAEKARAIQDIEKKIIRLHHQKAFVEDRRPLPAHQRTALLIKGKRCLSKLESNAQASVTDFNCLLQVISKTPILSLLRSRLIQESFSKDDFQVKVDAWDLRAGGQSKQEILDQAWTTFEKAVNQDGSDRLDFFEALRRTDLRPHQGAGAHFWQTMLDDLSHSLDQFLDHEQNLIAQSREKKEQRLNQIDTEIDNLKAEIMKLVDKR